MIRKRPGIVLEIKLSQAFFMGAERGDRTLTTLRPQVFET